KPTATEKLCVGYHGPAMGDFDHPALSLLVEILTGGRASRLHRKLFEEREIATDLRAFVGPFRDPGLVELFVSARGDRRAEELLAVVAAEHGRGQAEPIAAAELDRASARLGLGLRAGLDTVEGKATTLGFYDVVLGRPAGAFERLE